MNKNLNPGNVKNNIRNPWKGTDGRIDNRGHAVFESLDYGFRAMARTWQAKWNAGKHTVRAILHSWQPISDTIGSLPGNPQNNPDACAEFIGRRSGVLPDSPLPDPTTDLPQLALLLAVLAHWETGKAVDWPALLRGVALWYEDFGK